MACSWRIPCWPSARRNTRRPRETRTPPSPRPQRRREANIVQDLTLTLGHFALLLGLLGAAWSMLGALLAVLTGGTDLQRSAERAVLVTTAMCLAAAGCLEYGFLTDDFRLDYVFHYSSTSQALPYKIGALWGGQAGSLLLWVSILAVMGSIMVATNRNKNRALMPHATGVVGLTLFFFMILLNFIESP